MRILVGAIAHESNTFTSLPTALEDFHVVRGEACLVQRGEDALSGIVRTLEGQGFELVPTLSAHALPGGRVTRQAYETFKDALLAPADRVDGACLFLHGAMRAEGVDYCESDLLAALRARLRPGAPIVVALDMHANLVAPMVENANALAAYHTAPHVDRFQTGERAARLLLGMLRGEIAPRMGFAKIPMLLPGEMAQTHLDPMASMMRLLDEIQAQPGVLDASLIKTHCWADVPDQGISALVVADGDGALAQREAERLAAAFWERRREFRVSAETYGVEEALEVALNAPERTVFLSDSGDNATAGGTTEIPVVLERMLARGVENAVLAALCDAEAVEICLQAGVGQRVGVSLGGGIDPQYASPMRASGVVRLLSDGRAYRGGVRTPENRVERGPIAVLDVGGIDVVLSQKRISIVEPAQLRSLGIEPLAYRIVVLKVGYLHAPFQAISGRSILMLSPGPTHCDVTWLPYRRVRRPIYPLDPDTTWSPGWGGLNRSQGSSETLGTLMLGTLALEGLADDLGHIEVREVPGCDDHQRRVRAPAGASYADHPLAYLD